MEKLEPRKSAKATHPHRTQAPVLVELSGGVASQRPDYHWGQKDYLPNLYSRQVVLGNVMCSLCAQESAGH